jgi:general secretion pathway protein K
MGHGDRLDRRGGFSLFAVLMFMLFIAAVAAALAVLSLEQSRLAASDGDRFRDEIGMNGFLILLTGALADSLENEPTRGMASGGTVSCELDQVGHDAVVINHAGLIDINSADQKMLVVGYLALGLARPAAERAAQLTALSRLPALAVSDDLRRQAGPAPLKFALFETVAELADIVGNDRFDLARALGIFTVQTRTASINPDLAPKDIVAALDRLHDPAITPWLQSSERSNYVTIVARRHGSVELERTAVFDIAAATPSRVSRVQFVDRISRSEKAPAEKHRTPCLSLFFQQAGWGG